MRVRTTGKVVGYVIVVGSHHDAYECESGRIPACDFVFSVRVQKGVLEPACTGSPAGTLFPNREAAKKAMRLPWKALNDSWERWSRWDIIPIGEYT